MTNATNRIRDLLSNQKRIFGVTFTKRTTGELRRMSCRLGVTKHLKGGQRAYDPETKGLLFVFDMNKQGYRSIPLENVHEIRINGQTIRPGA